MKEAILRPSITTAVLPSSKIIAININKIAQIALTTKDVFILTLLFIQSFTVDDAKELIDELRVDIAADITPANNNPFTPIGK